jgi:transcriptional regulator with XRE-family HTH domain
LIKTRIGDRIRELRNAKVWTQEELARVSGVGVTTIVRIELNYVSPHPKTIRKLADSLGVRPEDLVRT